MSRLRRALVTLVVLSQVVACPSLVWACTGITIKPKDGSIIFARTLEFAVDLKSNIIVVPRGKEYVGTTPGDKPGLSWKTKYGSVGANAFDLPVTVDGLNEKGLQVGLFYFPGFAKYQEIKAEDVGKALAPWELGMFLLGTCSDVKEAVAAAKDVLVGEVVQKDMGFVPGVHAIVTDASGKSVVLEYVGGELKVHANPLGVLTNSPTFDWHMTNLSNYVTMTSKNIEKIDLAGKEIKGLGQGSGMLGLPGDFTPPSRFVRAVAFSKTALPVEKAKDGVLQALNETLRWTRSTLAPFALVRLYSLVPHLPPVVLIIPVATICARAFPVACLSRRFDHAILLAFHGNLYHDSAPTALH